MNYKDPDNVQDIIKSIIKMKTIKEIHELLMSLYPTFLKDTLEEYSSDYPQFDINWRGLCLSLKVRKAFILLVDDWEEDDEHLLLKTFCEIFTQAGFIIRKHTDFIPCPVCKHVLPSQEMYNKLKENKMNVPDVWLSKCSKC